MATGLSEKFTVKITANFARNLEENERFLIDADATRFFDALLDELTSTVIPNIERFPKMARNFIDRPARSIEASNGLDTLRKQLGDGELREYVLSDFLLLYAQYGQTAYLLSIGFAIRNCLSTNNPSCISSLHKTVHPATNAAATIIES